MGEKSVGDFVRGKENFSGIAILNIFMLFTTHLLSTLIVSRALSLENQELYTALVAGVGVDFDHIFVNKKWVQDIKDFIRGRNIKTGINQHSWFQEFLFGSFVGIIIGILIHNLMPMIRWWIFPVFILLHIMLDALMKFDHWPFIPLSKYKYQGIVPSDSKIELYISTLGLLLYFFYF